MLLSKPNRAQDHPTSGTTAFSPTTDCIGHRFGDLLRCGHFRTQALRVTGGLEINCARYDDELMPGLASTPDPPYTAVIFTSVRADDDGAGYSTMAERMETLASDQPGYLGIESAREEIGITVSYWQTPAAARAWKAVAEHQLAQKLGRDQWYRTYRVRIATVERDYGFPNAT